MLMRHSTYYVHTHYAPFCLNSFLSFSFIQISKLRGRQGRQNILKWGA